MKTIDAKNAFSYCSWGSQGKNTEVVCHSLLQWTTFSQNSPPRPVCLGWLYMAWFSFIDCSHEVKRCLLLGMKVMTNIDSILKNRDITLPTKVYLVKAMIFPIVMYGCEIWTVKKAEHQRINAFEL